LSRETGHTNVSGRGSAIIHAKIIGRTGLTDTGRRSSTHRRIDTRTFVSVTTHHIDARKSGSTGSGVASGHGITCDTITLQAHRAVSTGEAIQRGFPILAIDTWITRTWIATIIVETKCPITSRSVRTFSTSEAVLRGLEIRAGHTWGARIGITTVNLDTSGIVHDQHRAGHTITAENSSSWGAGVGANKIGWTGLGITIGWCATRGAITSVTSTTSRHVHTNKAIST